MSVILPKHLGITISHNDHKMYYDTVEQFVGEFDPHEWASQDDYLKACVEDELWSLQCYPRTPVGFYTIHAPTFTDLMKILVTHFNDDLQEYA